MRRAGIYIALVFACGPVALQPAAAQKTEKNQYFQGKVLPLAELLGKSGIKLDADAAPYWLALVADDGKIYPLIKDTGSRMFFKDTRLLKRPMRITGTLQPGTNFLRVINVHSVKNGQLHEVFYWCDICTIRMTELDICDCCGGPLYLREPPLK